MVSLHEDVAVMQFVTRDRVWSAHCGPPEVRTL